MNAFQPFEHEVMASQNEKVVDYNLSESGVHPLELGELLGDRPDYFEKLLGTEIDYAYANGNPQLRENIAALYSGATSNNVLVTVGAIEANYNTIHTLLQPGNEMAEAMWFCLNDQHVVVEGGAAVGVAALLSKKINKMGKNIAVVLSGANVPMQILK